MIKLNEHQKGCKCDEDKMEKEFCLSDKINIHKVRGDTDYFISQCIGKEDVKEFIRLLNLEMDFLSNPDWREFNARLSKLSGEKLTQ